MKTEIEIPTVPNFLMVKVGSQVCKLPVAEIPEEELQEVGRQWTAKLLKNHHRPPINNDNLR
jgi:hypothetical protein